MESRSDTQATKILQPGDRVAVGDVMLTISQEFSESLAPGDRVLGIGKTGVLRRIPSSVDLVVRKAVDAAVNSFGEMMNVTDQQISQFFDIAANLLSEDEVFTFVKKANDDDVVSAKERGRSTTRLILSDSMRHDMVAALRMWETLQVSTQQQIDSVVHDGWRVEQWRSPLGVLGFVFEGRPNVFADATGVLRTGNTVVFRIGSDALGTARALMHHVIQPALENSGLPSGAVSLVDSPEHAAGWALFSDQRLGLAVARGSGEAVAELGAIAQQSGIPVSLHGTGGAWILAGENASDAALRDAVEYSLDRKVCNTANVVCVPRSRATQLVPLVCEAADRAALKRDSLARIHCVGVRDEWLPHNRDIQVVRASGVVHEKQFSTADEFQLGHEFEWEGTPEFFLVVVDHLDQAISLCNTYSPHFVVSVVSDNEAEHQKVWNAVDAPFVGNGFTRWVDGQFALRRPELGLSNWQNGRLFGRGGVLSGDSAFTVRLKVTQDRTDIHR